MLEFLRRGVKSWVAKALLLLLIASFAVWGISDVFSVRVDSAVATVGERTVSYEEFANALQRQRRAISRNQGRAVSYEEMRAAQFDRILLARLMRDKAFEEELERLGLAAPDAAVAEEIRSIDAFRSGTGGFSQSTYRIELGRLGYSPSEFEALTRSLLGQDLVVAAASGAAEPPPGMAARIAAWQGEERAAVSVLLPVEAAPDQGTPSEAELAEYFEANAEAYREPERRSGIYLHVDIEALAAEAEPTEAEIEAHYEENRAAFEQQPSAVIDQLPLGREGDPAEIAAPVLEGEIPLEALAAQLGEDPAALAIGEVERDDLPEAVADAVFSADGPGIVGPVQAPSGPVLVRIRELEPGGVQPLGEVRDRIARRIAQERALDRAPEMANEIDDLRAAGEPLRAIAEATGLELHRFEDLSRAGRLPDGTRAEGLPGREAFRAEVFEALDHEERDLVTLPDGGFFVALVEEIVPSGVPDLSEIEEQVVADWRQDARLEAVVAEAEALAAEVGPGRSLPDIAAERDLALTEHPAFPRQVLPDGVTDALGQRIFETPEGRAVAGEAAERAGALVVQVTEVSPPSPDAMEAVTSRLDEAIAESIAGDDREFFSRAVESRYPMTIDESIVDAVFERLASGGGA